MIRTLLKPLSFIPAILLMMMIYQFSAQPADVSSQLSYKVSYKIVETADNIFETNLDYWQMDNWAVRINGVTRKLAHMTEYFALAVAVSFPLYVYGVHGIWLMLLAGIICVGFAAGDEYHQSFIAGRGPSVRDVGIDSFGVFWGIILVRIIGWTGRKTIFRPRKKKVKVKKVKQYKKTINITTLKMRMIFLLISRAVHIHLIRDSLLIQNGLLISSNRIRDNLRIRINRLTSSSRIRIRFLMNRCLIPMKFMIMTSLIPMYIQTTIRNLSL